MFGLVLSRSVGCRARIETRVDEDIVNILFHVLTNNVFFLWTARWLPLLDVTRFR